jgi:hypothetical protein
MPIKPSKQIIINLLFFFLFECRKRNDSLLIQNTKGCCFLFSFIFLILLRTVFNFLFSSTQGESTYISISLFFLNFKFRIDLIFFYFVAQETFKQIINKFTYFFSFLFYFSILDFFFLQDFFFLFDSDHFFFFRMSQDKSYHF